MADNFNFLHPGVRSRIIDNAITSAQTEIATPAIYVAVESEFGPAGDPIVVSNFQEYSAIFGEPKLAKHGLGSYVAAQWLLSGGSAYVKRVVPADAAEAEIAFYVDGSGIISTTNTGTKLFTFKPVGADSVGTWYERYGVKISSLGTPSGNVEEAGRYDDGEDSSVFQLTIVQYKNAADTVGSDVESFFVTMNAASVSQAGQALYIKDVVDAFSDIVRIEVEAALDSEDPTALFTTNGSASTLGDAEGDRLANGSDGTFASAAAKVTAFADAYTTDVATASDAQRALLDRFQTTVTDVIYCYADLDNGGVEILNAMQAYAGARGDTFVFADLPIDSASAISGATLPANAAGIDKYLTAFYTQSVTRRDLFASKNITVPSVFYIASLLPGLDLSQGTHRAPAGPNRGVVSNNSFIGVNWIPTADQKEALYKKKINYLTKDFGGTYIETQLTSQDETSPLSNVFAVRTILEIRREFERIARGYKQEFATNEVYGLLQSALDGKARDYVLAGKTTSLVPFVYASPYERLNKIVRVRADITFPDLIERFNIDLIVGNNQ